MTISRSIWERLRKAGLISTYDKNLRDQQLRIAGPYKLMAIKGIGPRVARSLLKNAGWEISLEELERAYASLQDRTMFSHINAPGRYNEPLPKEAKESRPEEQPIARRYIAFTLQKTNEFNGLFELAKNEQALPYDGTIPHKLLHITIEAPIDTLLDDMIAKMNALAEQALPSAFILAKPHVFPNAPKAMFFGAFESQCNLIETPHITFAEFNSMEKTQQFLEKHHELLESFEGKRMMLESLAIVRKDNGIEYEIPLEALRYEKERFLEGHLRRFLGFLGHASKIKFQIFLPDKNGKKSGSGLNTYAHSIDEFVNLARKHNGQGIICVAVGEHGEKGTEDISNITKILALVIDVDVKKARKINYVSSSTDHYHAISVAKVQVSRELSKMGFKVGMINDSGNGAHVYVKVSIELPKDINKENWKQSEIWKKLATLENSIRNSLKDQNDSIVSIDFITKDCCRRIKTPGTINKKDVRQAEDRLCRIIYDAKEYAELENNEAFSKIIPSEEIIKQAKNVRTIMQIGEQAKVPDPQIQKIIDENPKIKALYFNEIIFHGKDQPLSFNEGKIFCKSRSEAELALVTELTRQGIRNYAQIDSILANSGIGKWVSDSNGSYRQLTYQKAMSYASKSKGQSSVVARILEKVPEIKI